MVVNPAQVQLQVKFALSQLPAHNAHHLFEQICRHVTTHFICSNVLPATGPVSAGGDQGRDFETFRTYLRDELGPAGAFLGLVSEGTVAFVCTTQVEDVTSKIRSDIRKVCSSGHPVHEIRAFTLAPVPVAARHALEAETQETYGVRLVFHDVESIADLLARPRGFWIAEQFLSLPAEIRPVASPDDGDLPDDYVELRDRWREGQALLPTLGTFVDLKTGLREAMYRQAARGDLPFWLGLMRDLLASSGLPDRIKQRARYELAVATLRGTGDLRPVDGVVGVYLDESLQESEPAHLRDASTLLMYVKGAVLGGVTTINPAELESWSVELTRHIEEQLSDETPHRRASLLFSLGFLCLHPALSDELLEEAAMTNADSDDIDTAPPPWAPLDLTLPEDYEPRDASRALSAWTEVIESLEEAPLFPVQDLANMLQLMLPLWSRYAEWRGLLDRVDEEIGSREGRSAVAERARDRAMALMKLGRILEALEELHQARVEWWSGDTLRGSVLASLMIAKLYGELRLYTAAKAYALGAATIAATSDDEGLADLAPRGLLLAANSEFLSGAWFSAAELYGLGLAAQHHMGSGGLDFDADEMIQGAVLHLAYISACARRLDSSLQAEVQTIVARSGFQDLIDDVLERGSDRDEHSWDSFGEGELSHPPFSDLGRTRCIRFSALGTDWTLLTANDDNSVGAAERFAAGVQMMLTALAGEDLCLIPTTITVRIEEAREADSSAIEQAEALPSNDGREWVVRLMPSGSSGGASREDINTELLTVLVTILREASLLPDDDLAAVVDRAFQRGLAHQLAAAVQLDEFVATFTTDQHSAFPRGFVETPWGGLERPITVSEELHWQDGPGPGYERDQANEMLRTRYETLTQSLRITVAVLARAQEFRSTVQALRADGWLDWHILTAISNITMNYRYPLGAQPSEETVLELMRITSSPESPTANPVPVALFTIERMQDARQIAMLSLLNHWGLECCQQTPDMPAIEQLLAARYGYWDDDVPHDDPFPEADETRGSPSLTI